MKALFFKTMKVTVSGRTVTKMRPIEGQTFENGDVVCTEYNCKAPHDIRDDYPLGTVFASYTCNLATFKGAKFYDLGDRIFPMVAPTELKNLRDVAPMDVRYAWEAFGKSLAEVPAVAEANKTFLTRMQSNDALTPPSVKDSGFLVNADNWYLMIRNINCGVNTMLVGATGTGKTEFVRLICKKLGKKLCIYDMGSMLDPIAGLLGTHRLIEGGSVFDYARFTEDIQEPNVILLDELSRAPVTANNILFPVLDNRRELPVEIAGGKDLRRVKVHPDCVFIATANVGAEYTGTSTLDAALVNRFFPIEMDALKEEDESRVLIARTGIEKPKADCIMKIAGTIRKLYRQQELSVGVSVRETLMVAELVVDGWEMTKALSLVFLPKFEGTQTDGERSVVYKLFMSR